MRPVDRMVDAGGSGGLFVGFHKYLSGFGVRNKVL